MKIITSRRAALPGLVAALLTALVLPAWAHRGGPGEGGAGGGGGAIPAGSNGVRATITAVDPTAGTLQITDRNGLSLTLKTSSSTVIQLDGKTATLANLMANDTALVVYDRTSLVASQILATSPPPTELTGTITAIDPTAGTVQVTTDHGTAITLTVNSNSQVHLNNSAITVANLAVGDRARVTYRPADKIALTLTAATPQAGVVTGAITAFNATGGTLQLTPLVGAAQNLTVNAQTTYRLNGRTVTAAEIAMGQLAAVQVGTNNTATIVAAETPPLINLLGTISALNVQGNTVQITTPGATTITLALGSFTTVQQNNAASTLAQLAVGDQVQVQYEYLLVPNTSRALMIVVTGTAPATTTPGTTTPTSPATTPATTTPTPAATGAVASLALNPTSVTGGTGSSGTVTLSAAAPTGGTVVTLASSNPAVAAVPSSVTVAAGATTAVFSVTTTTVTAATTVTLFASAGGATSTATLTVHP